MSTLDDVTEEQNPSDPTKQRFTISVPSPAAVLNMGQPDSAAKFGYPGVSITSAVHLLIDVNKSTLYQSGGSAMWQVGGKWLQYSNDLMYMSTKAHANLSADGKVTLAAGAGHGQHTSQVYGLQPRLVDYNNLKLHYIVDAVQNGVKQFFYGDDWETLEQDGGVAQDGFLKAVFEFEAKLRGIDTAGAIAAPDQQILDYARDDAIGPMGGWAGDHVTNYPSNGVGGFGVNPLGLCHATRVFPAFNAFDPYPAVKKGTSTVYNVLFVFPKVLLQAMKRLADVVGMIGAALADNRLMAKFQNLGNMMNAVMEKGYASFKRLNEGFGNDKKREYGYSFDAETDLMKDHSGNNPVSASIRTGHDTFDVQQYYAAAGTSLSIAVDGGSPQTYSLTSAAESKVTLALPTDVTQVVLAPGSITAYDEVTFDVQAGATSATVTLDGAPSSLALTNGAPSATQSIAGYTVTVSGQSVKVSRGSPFTATAGSGVTLASAKKAVSFTLGGVSQTLNATLQSGSFAFDTGQTLSGYSVSFSNGQATISRAAPFSASAGSEATVVSKVLAGAGEKLVVTIGQSPLVEVREVVMPSSISVASVVTMINGMFSGTHFSSAASAGAGDQVEIKQVAGLWKTTVVSVALPASSTFSVVGSATDTHSGGSFDDPFSVTAAELHTALGFASASGFSHAASDVITLTTDEGADKSIAATGPLAGLFSPASSTSRSRVNNAGRSWDNFRTWNYEMQKLPEDLRLLTRPMKNFVDDCVALASTVTTVMDELQDFLGLAPDAKSAVGVFAKDRIVLGTPGDLVANAGGGYTFVVGGDSDALKRNKRKYVLGERPVYWLTNVDFAGAYDRWKEWKQKKAEAAAAQGGPAAPARPPVPRAPKAGFRVLSSGDVRFVADSVAEIVAVGDTGRFRAAATTKAEMYSAGDIFMMAGMPGDKATTGEVLVAGRDIKLGWFIAGQQAAQLADERQHRRVETENLALSAHTKVDVHTRGYAIAMENTKLLLSRVLAAPVVPADVISLTLDNTGPTATLAAGDANVVVKHGTHVELTAGAGKLTVAANLTTVSTKLQASGDVDVTGSLTVGSALLVKSNPAAPPPTPPQHINVVTESLDAQAKIGVLEGQVAAKTAELRLLQKALDALAGGVVSNESTLAALARELVGLRMLSAEKERMQGRALDDLAGKIREAEEKLLKLTSELSELSSTAVRKTE
jgi:hypothetical protein